MFSSIGVFESLYAGYRYHPSKLILSTLTVDNDIASVMVLPENVYYGWEQYYPEMKDAYGMIGFYTKPKHRRNGYARKVFENFDKSTKIRKLSAHNRCASILKSVDPKDLLLIP